MVKCDQESEEGDDDIEVIGRNSHVSPILLNAGEIKRKKLNLFIISWISAIVKSIY